MAWSRSELMSIAREIGIHGSIVKFQTKQEELPGLIRAHPPAGGVQTCSPLTQRFFAEQPMSMPTPAAVPPSLGMSVPLGMPPLPPTVPAHVLTQPAAVPPSVGMSVPVGAPPRPSQAQASLTTLPSAGPVSPTVPVHVPKAPKGAAVQSAAPALHVAAPAVPGPRRDVVPKPPAVGAARAWTHRQADLARVGLIAVDCPGMVASNNVVCLHCTELEPCLEQALAGVPRYPGRYTPDVTTDLPKAGEAESAAKAEPEAVPFVPSVELPSPAAVAAPPEATPVQATASVVVPSEAPPPKKRGRPPKAVVAAPPTHDVSGELLARQPPLPGTAKAIIYFLTKQGFIAAADKTAAVWWIGGHPALRMVRLTADPPAVQFSFYADVAPESEVGIKRQANGTWEWDRRDFHQLEYHIRAAVARLGKTTATPAGTGASA